MAILILEGDSDLISRSLPVPGHIEGELHYVEVKIPQYYWRCLDHFSRKHGFTAGYIIHEYEKHSLRHPYDWDRVSDFFIDFLEGCVSAEKETKEKISNLYERGYNEPSDTAVFYTNYDMRDERPPVANDA